MPHLFHMEQLAGSRNNIMAGDTLRFVNNENA